jgi:hypothetical protein
VIEKPIWVGASFYINDRTLDALNASPFYSIRVANVDGIWGTDRSIESHPIPSTLGERHGDNFKRGKTITLSGTVQGLNLRNLREGQQRLKQALWTDAEFPLKFTMWDDTATLVYYTVYVSQDLDMPETQDTYDRYIRQWTVALRADDPRTRKVSDSTVYPTWQT